MTEGLAGLTELMSAEGELFDPDHEAKRAARRARRRRGWIVVVLVLALLLAAGGGYVAWALTVPTAAPTVVSQTPAVPVTAPAVIALPAEGASALHVSGGQEYLGDAGIRFASGTEEARPIASISKLITAMVILDAYPLGVGDPGPEITFSKADHDLYDEYYLRGATIAAMPTGSTMSLHDALATILIPSASNYAEAVSTWAFGSQGAYLDATAAWLEKNGLTGTTIVEPTGNSPRNTSTPTDLIALGTLAAADPVIAEIAATPSLTLPGPGTMSSTNDLLGTNGVTGLKTGNLGEGSYSLLYTASIDAGPAGPLSLTGVVLGGSSRASVDRDVVALIDSIRAGFHDVPLATAGQDLGSYSTPWGSTARIVVGEDASIFTWSDTPITVSMQTTTPVEYRDGEVVGLITWTAGPHTATATIELEGGIDPPTEWWRLTHPEDLGAGEAAADFG
ncbi:D-alanyl-D-alanine carboxypeptidase family protein [Microbacterium sp. P02]|uniref:D-alanyl-D-alanine carboxypeptidase family protein n=1 Tax=Microbacterium sp. P02 TaxID=3366260 RepID=UPI003671A3B8